MNSLNQEFGNIPNKPKRKKAYTKEQINSYSDSVIVSNLMKFASFFKNNLNMSYSDGMKKARPLVETQEGLNMIRKIKAQEGQQNSPVSIVPILPNQPLEEMPLTQEEKQVEVSSKPITEKVQGVKPKKDSFQVIEPYTSNYHLLLDIIPDLEQRLTEQDLDEVSSKLDEDILDLVFSYGYQKEDGSHIVNMIQPDGDDSNDLPDMHVILKINPRQRIVEVLSHADEHGATSNVYREFQGETHTNHTLKKQLNELLTQWLTGFQTQAHRIQTRDEKFENRENTLEYWKQQSDFFKNLVDEITDELSERSEEVKYLSREINQLQHETLDIPELEKISEQYNRIIEIFTPIFEKMKGEVVMHNGEPTRVTNILGLIHYIGMNADSQEIE